jgi:hypothetical protein
MPDALHVDEHDPAVVRINVDLSLIMNWMPRSRTVSPDLMYFAFSIIFTVPLTIPSTTGYAGRENKCIWENNPITGACLDIRRHSIDTSTASWVDWQEKRFWTTGDEPQ